MLAVHILLGLCGLAALIFIGMVVFIIGEEEGLW